MHDVGDFEHGVRQVVIYQDDDHRLKIFEYQYVGEPDLFLDYRDGDAWIEQIPMTLTAEKARAIADELKSWSVRIVHEYYANKRQTEAAKYGEDAVDEAEAFAHYADDPASNRFDSVEISGIVEPIGEAKSCSK
jgi:hypothetical protein